MCTVLLPPGDNPIAVNKHIISYHIRPLLDYALIQVSPPHIFTAYFSKIILIAFSHPRQLLRIPDPFLDVTQVKLNLSRIKYPTLLFPFFLLLLFYRPKWRLQIVS